MFYRYLFDVTQEYVRRPDSFLVRVKIIVRQGKGVVMVRVRLR